MTTTVTVGSSGRDQSTIQAAWNALPSTLADDYVFELYNDSTFSAGLDTSASSKTMAGFTVTIRPASGQGFGDSANKLTTDKLAYQTSQGVSVQGTGTAIFNINVAGVILDGLMVKHTTAGYAVQSTSTATIVRKCVLDAENFGGSFNTVVGGAFAEVTNCLIVQRSNDGGGIYFSSAAVFSGNTVIGNVAGSTIARRGVLSDGGAVTAKDNLILNFSPALGAADSGSFTSTDYNATDQASTGGSGAHDVTSLTISSVLTDVSSYANLDAKVKSSASSVIGAGVADGTYLPLDILKQTRSSPPTIGAYDYVAPVTTRVIKQTPVYMGVGSQQPYYYGS